MLRMVLLATAVLGCGRLNFQSLQSDGGSDGAPLSEASVFDASIDDAQVGDALIADGRVPDARTMDSGIRDAQADVATDAAIASCSDQIQNGDETAVDCGGRCGPCDRCGIQGELFCSSFEGASLGAFDGTIEVGAGAATISAERVFRGVASGRTFAPSETENAAFVGPMTPTNSGMLYARWYMYIEPGFTMDSDATRHTVHLFSDEANWTRYYLFNLREGLRVEFANAGISLSDVVETNFNAVRTNDWMCVQVSLEVNVQNSQVTFSVDGQTQSWVVDTRLSNGAPLREVVVGPHLEYLSTNNLTVYFDDFALATAPIACD